MCIKFKDMEIGMFPHVKDYVEKHGLPVSEVLQAVVGKRWEPGRMVKLT
jgi:hypothetical protein